ncbi:MAG: hypothetical protein ACYC4I_01805 [Minisyncoccota bacterium]
MKKIIVALIVFLMLPSVSFAASLTTGQVSAVIAILSAFGVDQATVVRIEQALGAAPAAASVAVDPPPAQASAYVPPTGSLYAGGGIGYDISFNTKAYPVTPFGFAVVGVTGGRAFVDNARLASEFSWSHFSSSITPTVYLNMNAPYGSTVAGHIGSPRACPGITTASSVVGAANGEPSACEGYNYGYNAAAHAYAYATKNDISSRLWWLDIEDANSWSPDPAVNDATIQGAIDYLNMQGTRVGIYSVPYMWKTIAGAGFIPTQIIGGNTVSIPTWFPVGIKSQVGAINSCLTSMSFIKGSPVWIIQYEADSTSVDQNIAC